MESWSYTSCEKGFVLDDSVSGTNGIAGICKTELMGSELKSPWSYGCNALSSNQGGDQNQEFVELGSLYMMRNYLPDDSVICDGRVISSVSVPPIAFSGEDDSSSMFSISVVESNPRDSSLIDLKLGRVNEQADIKPCSTSAKTNLYSLESSIPVKRARAGGLGCRTPYCHVQGCRKDLSSCKGYYKRHKVCEIHSKSSNVIVNGIEQRFCQQCSRFHLLAEFDEGKRSCRKRLAGHNERRRKPHIRVHASREGRLFQSFNVQRGIQYQHLLVCQDILPTCQLRDHNNISRPVKLEDETDLRSHFTISSDVQQSLFAQHTPKKQCLNPKSKINEKNSYFQDIADSSLVSHTAFSRFSHVNEDITVLDSSFTIEGLSDVAYSGGALSLLSSQSQRFSILTLGVPTVLPLVSSDSRAPIYGLTKPPETLMGMSSVGDGTSGIDRIFQQPANMNSKDHFPFQQGPTIDLLQLLSQLQRVEHQRQYSIRKHEDDDFSSFRNT